LANVRANGIQIEYDTFGERSGRPLLLVMGLGAQMIHWRAEFCERLADAGHFVVRYDNRDVGLSTKLDAAGRPDIASIAAQLMSGAPASAPYSLDDMADDGLALLDALDLATAHVCGASLGGMIVQAMAIRARERIRTLTSIMSTTGNRDLPPATPEAMAALMSPPAKHRDEVAARALKNARIVGSPAFPADPQEIEARALEAFDRANYPVGVARQMAAAATHGNRKERLAQLDVPALVIHGRADPLIPVEGGIDTHEALRGSRLLVIDGMGHDLPREVWPQIVDAITELTSGA
jgi:pimeloyl-ACP methyl ester carboxylesterase